MTDWPHLCEEHKPECVCPQHGMRYYWPKGEVHACVDIDCAQAFDRGVDDAFEGLLRQGVQFRVVPK